MNFLKISRMRCSSFSKQFTLPVTLLLFFPLLSLVCCSPITPSSSFSTSTASYSGLINPRTTLECLLREYNYKVERHDSLGRKCWDNVRAMSCWGRCDSNEIADWQFPFKISYHPVCIHDQRVLRMITLDNCEAGVEPGTSTYEYYDAVTCSCRVCSTSSANCEGLRHHNRRQESDNNVK